jgi:hypothetical protein
VYDRLQLAAFKAAKAVSAPCPAPPCPAECGNSQAPGSKRRRTRVDLEQPARPRVQLEQLHTRSSKPRPDESPEVRCDWAAAGLLTPSLTPCGHCQAQTAGASSPRAGGGTTSMDLVPAPPPPPPPVASAATAAGEEASEWMVELQAEVTAARTELYDARRAANEARAAAAAAAAAAAEHEGLVLRLREELAAVNASSGEKLAAARAEAVAAAEATLLGRTEAAEAAAAAAKEEVRVCAPLSSAGGGS